MSYNAKPEEIGQYLDNLITRKYGSRKAFSRKFLDKLGETDEDTQNTENRFYKIVKGTNEIPAYDLLLTSELLDVSCEEILSAGKLRIPTSAHITNYDIACSDDLSLWKQYLDHGCTLYLDEFKKSVIDYAFEKKNIKLFKYMIEEDIIWLVADREKDNYYREDDYEVDCNLFKYGSNLQNFFWESNIKKEERLRTKIMLLAIETGNSDVLDKLRARDTAEFNYTARMHGNHTVLYEGYNEEFVKLVAEAVAVSESNSVLDYFSVEYLILDENSTVVCPFYSWIIESLIIKEKYDYAEKYLERAIDHNKKIYELIQNNINEEYQIQIDDIEAQKKEEMMWCYSIGTSFEKHGRHFPTEEETMDRVISSFEYDKVNHIVFYRKPYSHEWILSNLVCVSEMKGPKNITTLIDKLNEWNNKFVLMDERKHEGLGRLYR